MGGKLLWLSVAFIICFMKSEHVRAQCSLPHFGENVVLDQFLLSSSFSDGSTVTFECIGGYKPVDSKASRSVTCLGNNKWTDLALRCTKKPCGSLPDFSHGRYEIPDGILFGDTVTAVCDKGYMLSGRGSQRTCRADGWDGRDPVCEAVKCPPPPVVENGQLEDVPLESYEYLQAVTYKCNSGFDLGGNSALHCSENGTFQPAPPKCFGGCPKPEIPHSVRIGGKSPPYKLGNFITYKCEDGYDLKGAETIRCTENEWEPEPPKCDVKNVDPGYPTPHPPKPTPHPPNPTPHPPNPTPHPPNPTPTPTSTSTYVLSILGAIIGVALIGGAVYYFKGKNSKREYSQKVPRNEEGGL